MHGERDLLRAALAEARKHAVVHIDWARLIVNRPTASEALIFLAQALAANEQRAATLSALDAQARSALSWQRTFSQSVNTWLGRALTKEWPGLCLLAPGKGGAGVCAGDGAGRRRARARRAADPRAEGAACGCGELSN